MYQTVWRRGSAFPDIAGLKGWASREMEKWGERGRKEGREIGREDGHPNF